MPKRGKGKSRKRSPSTRVPKLPPLAQGVRGVETEAPVALPGNDTVVDDVARRVPEQEEEDDSDDLEDEADKRSNKDYADDHFAGENDSESESSSVDSEQQKAPEPSNENDEISKINERIVKIEANIAATEARVAEKKNGVEQAKAASRAFNKNRSVEQLFQDYPFTKDLISPSQSPNKQRKSLTNYLVREEQAYINLTGKEAALVARKAGLMNLLVGNNATLAKEQEKLPPVNQNVPWQLPGHQLVAPSEPATLSIKSNPKMYLEELNKILLKSFEAKLEECFITIPRNWSSYNLCQGRIMDLTFLKPLRLPGKKEVFLPETIFIRDCMKTVFQVLCDDATNRKEQGRWKHTVLIGSAGVGKSILFFWRHCIELNIPTFCTTVEQPVKI